MASAARREDAAAAASRDARLRLLIASGGDDRIWPDPITRRNRYGAPATPAPDELWFSSSTACAVSPRGWEAASEALDSLTESGRCGVGGWFDGLRSRLAALYGAPGTEVVLSASGTEAELVALQIALAMADGPLVNIVVAPAETGSGVPAAAAGRHFLGRASLGGAVSKGERLCGWDGTALSVETLEIRASCGAPRTQSEIDDEAMAKADAAVAGGAFALLHVLDASKTGRPGVSRRAAAAIAWRHAGRVLVVVDACQLRCSPETVRDDLDAGFAVMITGSKFAGGPAFCGALLLPVQLAELVNRVRCPASPLAPYSAKLDWPAALRPAFAAGLAHPINLGLGLRWSAALAQIEAYYRLPASRRETLLVGFEAAVRARVAADLGLALLDDEIVAPGLVPIVHADGSDPRGVYEALQNPADGSRPCHLGQPVAIGPRTALRVCASMPMISDLAERGLAALEADLDVVFAAWVRLRA